MTDTQKLALVDKVLNDAAEKVSVVSASAETGAYLQGTIETLLMALRLDSEDEK